MEPLNCPRCGDDRISKVNLLLPVLFWGAVAAFLIYLGLTGRSPLAFLVAAVVLGLLAWMVLSVRHSVQCKNCRYEWDLRREPPDPVANSLIKIEQTTAREDRVRQRYRADLEALQAEGFEEYCFYAETGLPFGLIMHLLLYVFMLAKGEVISIGRLLRFSAHYPLLVSRQEGALATISSLGITFYTRFNDGTWISSGSQKPTSPTVKGIEYTQHDESLLPDAAWAFHRKIIEERGSQQIDRQVSFDDYVQMSLRKTITGEPLLRAFGSLWLGFIAILASLLVDVLVQRFWPGAPDWIGSAVVLLVISVGFALILWERRAAADT